MDICQCLPRGGEPEKTDIHFICLGRESNSDRSCNGRMCLPLHDGSHLVISSPPRMFSLVFTTVRFHRTCDSSYFPSSCLSVACIAHCFCCITYYRFYCCSVYPQLSLSTDTSVFEKSLIFPTCTFPAWMVRAISFTSLIFFIPNHQHVLKVLTFSHICSPKLLRLIFNNPTLEHIKYFVLLWSAINHRSLFPCQDSSTLLLSPGKTTISSVQATIVRNSS